MSRDRAGQDRAGQAGRARLAGAAPAVHAGSPFRRRTAMILAAVGAASFVSAVVLAIWADGDPPRSAGTSSYSRSALGHKAFAELLRALDVPVLVSEHDTAAKVADAVLVVAEPILTTPPGGAGVDDAGEDAGGEVAGDHASRLRAMIAASAAALIVLPKWYGVSDPDRPEWVSDVAPVAGHEVDAVLAALGIVAGSVRVAGDAPWHGGERLRSGLMDVDPARIELRDAQLIAPGGDVSAVVAGVPGALVIEAYVGDTHVLVLSDPDVLSNHGLGRGDNAVLAWRLIDQLRAGDQVVVIDETLHGYDRKPSIWRALFEFPLATTTIAAVLAVLLLLWAATARFGKPLPPAPAIAPGKGFLIDNTAALLRAGGHAGHALSRYLHATIHDVAAALHAPLAVRGAGLHAWLDRVGAARGVRITARGLEREVAELAHRRRSGRHDGRVVDVARRIHQWRQEMIHGSRVRQDHL